MSVTPPKPHDELALAAARLSRAAPNSWVDFVSAFEAYAAVKRDACVQAPADKIFQAQGKAQQCAELSLLLSNAIKSANEAKK